MPRTLVSFHAHPDDEVIATGGVIARAAADGHRVVIVFATGGELGEAAPGSVRDGETIRERRAIEAREAADVLGAAAVEFLGYRDSGMMGEATNEDAESFWQADIEEAAQRLADLLRRESADVLTIYDPIGNYGHPDHIQVHRVGARAAEIAGTADVYEATMNRDVLFKMAREHPNMRPDEWTDDMDPDTVPFGSRESEITTCVDIRDYALQKREALACHASQVAEEHFFLAMPPDVFTMAFGLEWFIRHGASPGRIQQVDTLVPD